MGVHGMEIRQLGSTSVRCGELRRGLMRIYRAVQALLQRGCSGGGDPRLVIAMRKVNLLGSDTIVS